MLPQASYTYPSEGRKNENHNHRKLLKLIHGPQPFLNAACTSGSTNKTLYAQDPGERSSDPIRDQARLACECPGVSGGGVGQEWPDSGLGALTTTVLGATSPF